MTCGHQQTLSNNTKFSQDRVHAMDNMMMFIISHVTKLTKTEQVNMAEYILSVLATLNVFLERAFYFCSYFCMEFLSLIN